MEIHAEDCLLIASKFQNLENLVLLRPNSEHFPSEQTINILRSCVKLRCLSTEMRSFRGVNWRTCLSNLQWLNDLALPMCTLEDDECEEIAEICPNLVKFNVHKVSPIGMKTFGRELYNLLYFKTRDFTRDHLVVILDNQIFPKLRKLDVLYGFFGLLRSEIMEILEFRPNLEVGMYCS